MNVERSLWAREEKGKWDVASEESGFEELECSKYLERESNRLMEWKVVELELMKAWVNQKGERGSEKMRSLRLKENLQRLMEYLIELN